MYNLFKDYTIKTLTEKYNHAHFTATWVEGTKPQHTYENEQCAIMGLDSISEYLDLHGNVDLGVAIQQSIWGAMDAN